MNRNILLLISISLVAAGIFSIARYAGIRADARQATTDGIARFNALVTQAGDEAGIEPEPVQITVLPGDANNTSPDQTAGSLPDEDPELLGIPMVETGTISLPRTVAQPGSDQLTDQWMQASAASDTDDWAPKRLAAWKELTAEPPVNPIALLEIPSVGMQVPVYKGATDQNMDLGAGHITGTTPIGRVGNIGISGHRDGFFRDLQDISTGDSIRLQDTRGVMSEYVIEEISIVTPQDVSVLYPDDRERLTLVTCYPFYFVGHAPKRYIVHAVRQES